MNCKPGDLARVVAPYVEPGRGAFVTVVRMAAHQESFCGLDFMAYPGMPGWVVEGFVRNVDGEVVGPTLVVADECLRKVDPGQRADETLTWAGKPEGVTA